MTEFDKTLDNMSLETPDCTEVSLTPEEVEVNTKDLSVTDDQFGFLALTLRNRMTSVIGETMQFIEITGLTPEAQNALKLAVKRSVWLGVRDYLSAIRDVSELDAETTHELIYGKQ